MQTHHALRAQKSRFCGKNFDLQEQPQLNFSCIVREESQAVETRMIFSDI